MVTLSLNHSMYEVMMRFYKGDLTNRDMDHLGSYYLAIANGSEISVAPAKWGNGVLNNQLLEKLKNEINIGNKDEINQGYDVVNQDEITDPSMFSFDQIDAEMDVVYILSLWYSMYYHALIEYGINIIRALKKVYVYAGVFKEGDIFEKIEEDSNGSLTVKRIKMYSINDNPNYHALLSKLRDVLQPIDGLDLMQGLMFNELVLEKALDESRAKYYLSVCRSYDDFNELYED